MAEFDIEADMQRLMDSVDMTAFSNSHLGKPMAILSSDEVAELDGQGWRQGATCSTTTSRTAPVGTEMYVASYTLGWNWKEKLPVSDKRYALASVVGSQLLREATKELTASYRTDFMLLEDA